jgi:hypothetical protein
MNLLLGMNFILLTHLRKPDTLNSSAPRVAEQQRLKLFCYAGQIAT